MSAKRVVVLCLCLCFGLSVAFGMKVRWPVKGAARAVELSATQRRALDDRLSQAKGKVMRGDAQGAIAECDAVLEVYPMADCYRVRGIAYRRLGERAKACADLSMYMELDLDGHLKVIDVMYEELGCDE
jgi:regulator of sirC expression with transglutaminase-like and TPR domain